MGVDLYGDNPTDEVGTYFRSNIWYWRPLWVYCEFNHPNIANKVKYPYSNDGDGLNAAYSKALSKAISNDLKLGKVNFYADVLQKHLDSLPKIPCTYCNQTGKRIWNEQSGQAVEKICNVCNGCLEIDPIEKSYCFSIEFLSEFSDFLKHCGGFKIF